MAHAQRLRLALLCIALPLLATLARSAPLPEERGRAQIIWDAPTLHLLWNDAYGLYPGFAFDAMRREVEDIFARNGLSVRVHRAKAGRSLTEYPEPRVNAILAPSEAESWNLGPNAMAAAIGEPGRAARFSSFTRFCCVRSASARFARPRNRPILRVRWRAFSRMSSCMSLRRNAGARRVG